jgi:hypothetical protein
MTMLVPTLLLVLAAPPAEPELASAAQPAPAPTERRPRPRPLGPVGSGGIVLGGAGLGVAIAGIVRMTQPKASFPDPSNHELLIVTDTPIQGAIVLGAGLAGAAAGAAMLAIDLAVLRKRSARRLAVAPTLAPTMAGLDLRLRFSLGGARLR